MHLFDKLKQGLKKTASLLKTDIRDLFKSEGRLVDDAFGRVVRDAGEDGHGRRGGPGDGR